MAYPERTQGEDTGGQDQGGMQDTGAGGTQGQAGAGLLNSPHCCCRLQASPAAVTPNASAWQLRNRSAHPAHLIQLPQPSIADSSSHGESGDAPER